MSQVFSVAPNSYIYSISNINRQDYTEPALDFHTTFVNGSVSSLGPDSFSCNVKSVCLMNLIPNISKYNNQFSVIFNSTTYTLLIPTNNYDVPTVLTQVINPFLTGINAGLSMSYNSPNSVYKTLTLTIPANSTFAFNRPIVTSQAVQNSYAYRASVYDRCLDWMGFIPNTGITYTTTGSPLTITAGNPVNLYGTSYVDVTIPNNVGCVHMAPLGKSIVARVPIQVQFGQLQFYEPTVQNSFTLSATDLDNLHITVYDAWGWPLDTVPPNTQFSLKLVLVPLNQD